MDYSAVKRAAFLDELEKIAISRDRLDGIAKGREGARPMSVDTLLKKEKDGTLYKAAGDWAGAPVEVGVGVVDPAGARRPRKPGDVPTQDDSNKVDRIDGRGEASTTPGLGSSFNNIAATGNSSAGT